MKRLSFLRRNRREFPISLWFFGGCSLLWWALNPQHGKESGHPMRFYGNAIGVQLAGQLVIGVITAFLCLNAARDEMPPQQRVWLNRWMLFLAIWLGTIGCRCLIWWDNVPEFLRPPPFRG